MTRGWEGVETAWGGGGGGGLVKDVMCGCLGL